ncbi:MAG: hypothetical protein R3B07_19995 [Polyangiaceae bacterium]
MAAALGELVDRGLVETTSNPGPRLRFPNIPGLRLPPPPILHGDPIPGEECFRATPLGRKAAMACAAIRNPSVAYWRLGGHRLHDQLLAAVPLHPTLQDLDAACCESHLAEVEVALVELVARGELKQNGYRYSLTPAGLGKKYVIEQELAVSPAADLLEKGVDNSESPGVAFGEVSAIREQWPLAGYEADRQPWFSVEPPVRDIARNEADRLQGNVELVIAVATPVERIALLAEMKPCTGRKAILKAHVAHETYYVGRLGAHNVAVVMSQMGTSVKPSGSAYSVADALRYWRPRGVIAVGIAFGKDPWKQKIADVLISEQVSSYELQRVGTGVPVQRGGTESAGPTLLNRSRNITGWRFSRPDGREVAIHVGPILSGEKLIDDLDFRTSLFAAFPNAIGGEMEATGIVNAALREQIEWLIIKGICDWGYGKGETHQALAAAAAVSLLSHMLSSATALDGLR